MFVKFKKGTIFAVLFILILFYYLFDLIYYLNTYKISALNNRLPPRDSAVFEAIVVLAGDRGRINVGIQLLRNRKSKYLILSGIHTGVSKVDVLSSQGDAAYGVQDIWDKIIIEDISESTVTNAIESLRIINEFGNINRLIIVTSDYHIKRAIITFKKKAKDKLDIIPFSVSSSHETLGMITKLIVEHLKLFLYSKISLFY